MKKIAIALGLVLAAVSCNKAELNEEQGVGVLNMSVSVDAQTKAALTSDELLNTASVKIYKANFKGQVREYIYSNMPTPFYLAADTYRVDVQAGEIVKENPALASWEQKSYKGSKEFVIKKNNVTDVEVEAFVNNAVTCIGFDQTVEENFAEGYTFTIGLGDAKLVYDASKSGAEGYFIVEGIKEPSFDWTFTGTLLKDGSTFAKTGTINNVAAGKVYKMNLKYTIKDGDLDFTLMVDYTTDNVDDTIVFVPVMTGLLKSSVYEIWAAHADVHAIVDSKSSEGAVIQFGYSSNGTEWSYADAVPSEVIGEYQARLTGLTPSTSYTYKLVINGEDVGEPGTFTTDLALQLPNASFEYVSKVDGEDFYKFYDPDCGVEGANTKFWASGNGDEQSNKGLLGLPGGFAHITVPDTDDFYSGDGGKQSVRAQSMEVMGMKLAAGNLFTGQFVQTEGTSGGTVNFGRPWTSRPTAIKFMAKYTTDKINYTDSRVSLTTSDLDRAQIKVAFGTWDPKKYGGTADSPVQVNTTMESTFVDFYNDTKGGTVANCDVIIYHDGYDINKGGKVTDQSVGEWKEYVIPINYQKLNVYPTHIIISCSASQYGDYFVGSTSSKLWLDAFELIYE